MSLSACELQPSTTCVPSPGLRVFQASEIDNDLVDLIWLELPSNTVVGSNPGRLFIAKQQPPSLMVPSMIDLECVLPSAGDRLRLGPTPTSFEFQDDRQFVTRYRWFSCPVCRECYMVWSYILTVEGRLDQDRIMAKLSLIHMLQERPGQFLTVELEPVTNPCLEPRIECDANWQCHEIYYITSTR